MLEMRFTCRLTAWGINPYGRTGPSVSYFFHCALGEEKWLKNFIDLRPRNKHPPFTGHSHGPLLCTM